MKPDEYWNCTYREIQAFCNSNICRKIDDIKQDIQLFELTSDKVIQSNPYIVKNPKQIRLIKEYSEFFEQEEREQTPEEQIAILRSLK